MTCRTCDGCRFSCYNDDAELECRANPPSLEGWPVVAARDWCGKWEDVSSGLDD